MDNFGALELDDSGVDERIESVLLLHDSTTTPTGSDVAWPVFSTSMTMLDSPDQIQIDDASSGIDWNGRDDSSPIASQQVNQTTNPTLVVNRLRLGNTHQLGENDQAAYWPVSVNTMADSTSHILARWTNMATAETASNPRQSYYQYDVCDFFSRWAFQSKWGSRNHRPAISDHALHLRDVRRPDRVTVLDLNGDRCDIQGIDWRELKASRTEARSIRNRTCPSKHFQTISALRHGKLELPCGDTNYRFRHLKTRCQPRYWNRELRNLLAAPTRNSVFYVNASKIDCFDPSFDRIGCVADFSKVTEDGSSSLRISVLDAGNGVLLAGAVDGEYALKPLSSENDGMFTIGTTGRDVSISGKCMVNHIHTFSNRLSGLPQAVFSSNDSNVRVLDCHTNRFVQIQRTEQVVNCSATSPDGRLRLYVGDESHPTVVEAESGREVAQLHAHQDHGFACDWAPDGIHMATGHEDGTVAIWDARFWSRPYKFFETEIGGARSLRFSPLGGGRPALLVAEPADIVSIVDAVTYESRQRLDFFGEIGGVAFSPEGRSFFVANTDDVFGGVMEFERAGRRHEPAFLRQERLVGGENVPKLTVEPYCDWICEDALDEEDNLAWDLER